jgi:hypothetical protein
MSRRVPVRKSRRGWSRTLLLVAALAVAAAGVAVPAASYATADVPRSSGMNVADDGNGLVGLEKATTVGNSNRELLVTVTNNFDEETTVTVSLVDGGGTLYYGSQAGQSVAFTLNPGSQAQVDVEASSNGLLDYEVSSSADGTTFELQRAVKVRGDGPPPCTGPPSQRPPECDDGSSGPPDSGGGPPNNGNGGGN